MKRKSLLIVLLMVMFAPLAMFAQQSLPYEYGFENNNLATDGWTATSGGINSSGYHTGTYGFRFSYNVTSDVYLVSPVLSGGTNGVEVSFYYKAYSSSYPDHFNVGYTTDENVTDPSRFTYGSLVTSSTSWQEYTETLPAGTVRVAIKYDADNYDDGYYLYLDDFSFEAVSSCAKPTDLAIDYREGATSATVTWRGDARSYNVDVNGTIEVVTGNSYTIRDLAPATSYTVKVQADCGEEQSAWVNAGSFTTPCPETFAIPYAYGFENAAGINCWTLSPASNMMLDDQEPEFAHSGNAFLFLNYTTTPPQYVISPELSGIVNGLHVEFWYSQYENGVETFQVGYSTTDNDPGSFTWGDEITASTTYQRFSANYPAETKYVAVMHTANDQYYLFLDDFLFEESASCLEPTGVQVADITTTGATLSWNAGGEESAWDIFVTDDATILPNDATIPTVANIADNPYALTGLTSGTTYYVYVRAICGENEISAWSSAAIFNTACNAMALPYTYGFEDATLPVCWNTIVENTSYTGINLMAPSASSTNQVLAFYMGTYQNPALVAVLPEVDAAYPLNGYQITFDACYANTSSSNMTAGKLAIGIMTDPTDVSTFELIEEVDITDGFSTFGSHTVMLNSYTGDGQYIAIKDIYTQTGYVLVDNIEVTELPSCLAPTALTASLTATSAELSWTANSSETAWTLYWKESGANEYTEVANATNPYTLEGLTATTAYEFYVIANCSEEDNSEPSAVFTFTTKCDPITDFPWSEDFEDFQTSTYGVTLNEPCWENEHLEGNGSYFFEVINITNGDNSTNQLRLHDMSSGNLTKLVLPGMNLPNANFQFSIDVYRNNSYSTYTTEGIRVFASANGEIEGATELAFIPRVYSASSDVIPAENAAGWYTYNLPIGMSGTCYIIIRGESKWGAATYMDNFAVSEPSFTTTIIGYTQNENPKGGYYLIASPIGNVNPDKVDNMLANEYDLYYFDQTHNKLEWVNYETTSDGFDLLAGKGYLYANSETVDLVFHGSANTDVDEAILTLESGVDFEGWNLVGNPFGDTAYIDREFYVMNGSGSEIAVAEVNYIEPMQGVFVIANQDQETLKFTTTAPANQGKKLVFNISQGRGGVIDRAIIRFDEGQELPKFQLFDNSTKLAIEQNSKEFAVVHSRAAGEMPMNFKAETDGNYTLTVSETLNTQLSTLNLIDHLTGNVIDLLENPSYSFNANTTDDPARFTVVFRKVNNDPEVTQNVSVNAGWNWWSTYMEMIGIDGVQLLENALGDNGIQIKSQMAFASNSTNGWEGSLGSIKNESMYMIKVEHADDYAVTGNVAYPTDHTIRLTEGWNWVGYVQNNIMELNEALVNMPASDEDIIKSLNGFAIYYEDYGWWGELQNLQPGQGYMIRSNTSSTFTYPDNAKSSVDNMPMNVEKYWNNAIGKYAHNMNLMAVIEMNGNELRTENAELAAFDNNDECRGSAILMYVKPIDRYVAFLTVQGNNNEPIHFMVRNQNQNYKVNETVTMIVDEVIGTAHNPFRMTLKGAGISENSTALSIFPNPTTKGQQVRIELPVTMDNATIEIIDVLGRVVYENIAGGDDVHTVSTPDVPGVYTVRVTDAQGQTFHGRLTVK